MNTNDIAQPQVFYVDEENEQTAFKQLIKVGYLLFDEWRSDRRTDCRSFKVAMQSPNFIFKLSKFMIYLLHRIKGSFSRILKWMKTLNGFFNTEEPKTLTNKTDINLMIFILMFVEQG